MNWWRNFRFRLRALLGKQQLESHMADEMRSHLEMQTQENIKAGMAPGGARQAALRQFGSLESIKEACRDEQGVRWIEHFGQDLGYAARALRKNPGFTAVAVLTLALGIGANTAIFSIVDAVLLRALPFPEPDRLVMIWESDRALEKSRVSDGNFVDWQKQNNVFEAIGFSPAWGGSREFNVVSSDGTERVSGAYVSSGFFSALGVRPAIGRAFLPDEDERDRSAVAILSDRFWKRRFGGDRNVVGKVLTVDSFWRRDVTIVGVMPAEIRLPGESDLWLEAGWLGGTSRGRRDAPRHEVFARLKPGISLPRAQLEMNTIQSRIAGQFPEIRARPQTRVVPLRDELIGRMRWPLFILSGAVGLVLLIACANVANLLLARAVSRQKEIAVRMALGAGRGRIVQQLLTESVLLSLIGAGVGALLAYWGVKLFGAVSPANIPRLAEVSIDGTALCFTVALALVTGVVFGLAPAWQFSRPDLNDALKEGTRAASMGIFAQRTRNSFVIAEIALATVLLIGAGLMLQSFTRLMATDRGFRPEHLVTADLDFSVSGFTTWVQPTATRPQIRLKEVIDRARQLPGVEAVGAASRFVRQDNQPPIQPFAIFGRAPTPAGQGPTVHANAITPDCLRALGSRLLRGRDFSESDSLGAPGVVLINEAFGRRFFPNQNPLGQFVKLGVETQPLDARDVYGLPVWSQIVGVINDVKSLTTQPEAVPEIYWSYWQWPMQNPTLYLRAGGEASAVMAALAREIKAIIPGIPAPRIRLMRERLNESVAETRLQTGLLNLFGGMALILAACGIYGVLAYTVTQRQQEIGIRMALGARPRDVLKLVLNHGLRLTLIGVAIGIFGALALTRFMTHLLYEIKPADPLTFFVVALVLIAVAAVACLQPARRATKVDPMVALRYE